MSRIDSLTAAQLSLASYTSRSAYAANGGAVDGLPDWNVNVPLSSVNGDNQFIVFVNQTTQQVVVGFKGTNTPSQLVSDLVNDGGANWEGLRSAFATSLAQIQAQYPGYEVMTDGHSVGGGMAQTAALEYNLSGYGQNSLPIA